MKKCEICGKEVNDDEIIELRVLPETGDTPITVINFCQECFEPLKDKTEDDFKHAFETFAEELRNNWTKGTAENSKPGEILKIIQLKGEEDFHGYLGKTGVITKVDDSGKLYGTWGSFSIMPDKDEYLILKLGDNNGKEN